MSWFAFTTTRPDLSAPELRRAGYDAFAVMMIDRRQRHRHPVKGTQAKAQKWEPRAIVALRGYVFAAEPDLWHIDSLRLQGKLRHLGQPVKFCGQVRPIRTSDIEQLLDARGLYFRDDNPPASLAHRPPALVSPGDIVRFDLAAQTIEAPVIAVDGDRLLVRLSAMLLGCTTATVRMAGVEKVA